MESLIPPDVRSRLRGLRIDARRAAGAQGLGLHHSRSRGAGLEFAQYRAYEPGDEPRQIDWKLYARSDRFFVREAERESPVALWIVIDTSASMAQEDEARPGWSRLDLARGIAACIGELALRQGDRWGLLTLGERIERVAPESGTRQRDRMLIALYALAAGGQLPAEPRIAAACDRIGANDLVVVLSDGFDAGMTRLMLRLAAARREVLAIQLLTGEERDFPFRDGRRFRDIETGEELLGDPAGLRADFLARFAAARAALAGELAVAGIRHTHAWLDEPMDAPLARLFGARETVRG